MSELGHVTYKLPFPPSLNRIWRAHGSRILLSVAARAFYRHAHNALVGLPVLAIRGRCTVVVQLHPPRKLQGKPWDVANREKCLMDAMTKQRVWLDDSQVDTITLTRADYLPAHPNGLAVVAITYTQD